MLASYLSDPLWQALAGMPMDEPGVAVPLTARLACETGLESEELAEAITVYKQCLYAAIVQDIAPVMPLRAERVWKTHITYTRHYWVHMCAEVLGKNIHHVSVAELDEREPEKDHAEIARQAFISVFGNDPPTRVHENVKPQSSGALLRWWGYAAVLIPLFVVTQGAAIILFMIALFAYHGFAASLREVGARRFPSDGFEALTEEDRTVRDQILQMDIANLGPRDNPLLAELATGTGKTAEICSRAIEEYKRFLFVKYKSVLQVTPSGIVDEVWHLHMQHSAHYWDVLCGEILSQPFHHNPACGKPGEWAQFRDQYLRTIAAYTWLFREAPPVNYWPRGPSIQQRRALVAGLVSLVFIISLHVALHLPLGSAVTWAAMPGAAVAGLVAFRWPVNDALVTLHDFRNKTLNIEQWWSAEGGCGGCGGCGG